MAAWALKNSQKANGIVQSVLGAKGVGRRDNGFPTTLPSDVQCPSLYKPRKKLSVDIPPLSELI